MSEFPWTRVRISLDTSANSLGTYLVWCPLFDGHVLEALGLEAWMVSPWTLNLLVEGLDSAKKNPEIDSRFSQNGHRGHRPLNRRGRSVAKC